MTRDYSKYCFLEKYLFKEVRDNFQTKGFLMPEEFFCIVIWKANRAKSKILNKLTHKGHSLKNTVKELTSDIACSSNNYERLKTLIEKWQFRLPMATAILTVLYPNDFTIYDVRVCKELNIKDFSNRKSCIDEYFQFFLPKVRKVNENKPLRENDQYLWGKSFYQDLVRFLR